jgi:hypothetical protein
MFGIDVHMLCDCNGYAYNIWVYLGKDGKRATCTMTAVHASLTGLTPVIENVGHKL